MPKQVESVSARLQKAISKRTSIVYLPRKDAGIRGPLGPEFAFTLEARDKVLKIAFETFRLDPADPHSWRELLEALVEVLRPELLQKRKRAGNKKKWTIERRRELVEAIHRIQQDSSKKLNDLDACKKLLKTSDIPTHFRTTADALRKQVVTGRRQLTRVAHRKDEQLSPYLIGRKNRDT
jgi:hypothetical protein